MRITTVSGLRALGVGLRILYIAVARRKWYYMAAICDVTKPHVAHQERFIISPPEPALARRCYHERNILGRPQLFGGFEICNIAVFFAGPPAQLHPAQHHPAQQLWPKPPSTLCDLAVPDVVCTSSWPGCRRPWSSVRRLQLYLQC